jgi:hypothetical protein
MEELMYMRVFLSFFFSILSYEYLYSASAASEEILDAIFDGSLSTIKSHLGDLGPRCFISRACEQGPELDKKCDDFNNYLRSAGINTLYDRLDLMPGHAIPAYMERISSIEFVVVLFTPHYKTRSQVPGSGVSVEVEYLAERLSHTSRFYVPILLEGTPRNSIPSSLAPTDNLYYDLTDWDKRFEIVFLALREKLTRTIPQPILLSIQKAFEQEKAAIDGYRPAAAQHKDRLVGRIEDGLPSPAASTPSSARHSREVAWHGSTEHARHDMVRHVERSARTPALDRLMEEQFLKSLLHIKRMLSGRGPSCFLSKTFLARTEADRKGHAWFNYLTSVGLTTISLKETLRPGQLSSDIIKFVGNTDFVMVLFMPEYKERAKVHDSDVSEEVRLIRDRLKDSSDFYIPILLEGTPDTSIPESLKRRGFHYYDITDWDERFGVIFSILEERLLKTLLKSHMPQVRADFEREKVAIDAHGPVAVRHSETGREDWPHLPMGPSSSGFGPFEGEGAWGGGVGRPMPAGGHGFPSGGGETGSAGAYGPPGVDYSNWGRGALREMWLEAPTGGVPGLGYPAINPATWGGGILGEMGFGAPPGGMPGLGGGYGR